MQSETLYNLIKFASFCVTVLLSFGLAAFCCAKLCTKLGEEEGEKSMYMSMLTSVVSLWIPSPTSMMTLRMGGGANEPPVQDKRGVRRSMKLITDGGIMEEDHVVEMESATVQQKEEAKKEEEEEDE